MSFLTTLSLEDLNRLRVVAKRVFLQYNPPEFYTDREADRIIEAMGPEIMEQRIKQMVDAGLMKGKIQIRT